jgi:hypothetical protein
MTRLPELLDEAVGPVGVTFELRDLDRRVARRHRARVLGVAGAVAVVMLCVALVVTAVTNARSRSPELRIQPSTTLPVVPSSASDVLLFDDTGGVLAVDMTAHLATQIPIQGWRPGDQPFQTLRVGNSLVVGWDDVHASSLDGKVSRVLGTGVFVAATEPGAVWLTASGKVQTSTELLVDTQGHVLLQGPTPKESGTGYALSPLTGIPGGLAFQTSNGIDIWDARSGRITRHLGTSPGSAAPAFGSLLAWCDHCTNRLELTDTSTGTTRSVPVDVGGATLELNRVIFSPDGSRVAIPTAPDAAGPDAKAQVVVIDVSRAKVVEQLVAHDRYASVAWSVDSRRIYVAGSNENGASEIDVHDVRAGTTRDLGPVPPGVLGLSAVLSEADGRQLPSPAVGPAASCQPSLPVSYPATITRPCRYHF